ncbi:MAG: DUF502 domain-containing protein [Bdellovibrionales bacterium]
MTTTFLRGLFTILPFILSVYVFFWFLTWVERNARPTLLAFMPDFLYIPGMGVAVVFVVIYAFGLFVDRPLTRGILKLVENLLSEMPIFKTVYVAIKDFTEYLKPSKDRKNQVVLVKVPGSQLEVMGLMTRSSLEGLPEAVTKEDRVAVYLPMSYQFGGYTVFVPRAWVHPTTMSVDEAMRAIITAWLPGHGQKKGSPP